MLRRIAIAALWTPVAIPALAQTPADPPATAQAGPVALSFDAARARLDTVSPTLKGAALDVRASEEQEASLRPLNRPLVSASASVITYQKSLSIDLTGQKNSFDSAAGDFLDGLPAQFPGFEGVVQQVTGRIEQALPGLLGLIPDQLDFRTRDTVLRPNLTAVMPLYSGGAIPAVQRGAAAASALARAKQAGVRDLAQIRLVQTYFGQQLAAALLASAIETRDSLDRHLSNAQSLFREGVIPRARVLEVQVARDTAQRAVERAEMQAKTASDTLARLLDADGGVRPTTPLFVNTGSPAPLPDFLASATSGNHPQSLAANAAREMAGAGTDLAKSRLRPQAFAFGSYNLNRNDSIPVDPDWIVGVGVRYTLFSNIGRRHALNAAQAREAAAAEAAREARKTIELETTQAYNLTEAARRSFLLLDTNIVAAKENLRVQDIAFREGEGTASQLIDARNALTLAQTQRSAAAYEYVVTLAALLAASNRGDSFPDYLARADRIAAP